MVHSNQASIKEERSGKPMFGSNDNKCMYNHIQSSLFCW